MSPRLYGRLPALFPAGLRELGYYAAGPLPKPPAAIKVPEIADWQMLGNDQFGDCGVAGLQHGMMADAAVTGKQEPFPTDQEAINFYLEYSKGQDQGVVLSQYLAYVHAHGYLGHTVSGYAPVNTHDVPTIHSTIDLFDFAYTGIVVTEAMEQAFANGQPWTLEDLLSPVAGGHCIPLVGYDSQHLYAVTWGAVQPIAYSAWHFIAEEAWAVITGELAEGDGRGINLAALKADLAQLQLRHAPAA